MLTLLQYIYNNHGLFSDMTITTEENVTKVPQIEMTTLQNDQ